MGSETPSHFDVTLKSVRQNCRKVSFPNTQQYDLGWIWTHTVLIKDKWDQIELTIFINFATVYLTRSFWMCPWVFVGGRIFSKMICSVIIIQNVLCTWWLWRPQLLVLNWTKWTDYSEGLLCYPKSQLGASK